MSAAKLKNIVILALFFLNIFLLVLIVPTRLADLHSQQQANESLSTLYQQADVTLRPEDIPAYRPLYPADLTQSHNAALESVSALLGQQILSQPISGGTQFSSALGTVTLKDDGTFVASVTAEPAADPRVHAETLLDNMGIAHTGLRQEGSLGAVQTFTVTPTVDGVPLVTETLCLRYEVGVLTQITGCLPAADSAAVTSDTRCVSPQDALVAFLGSRMSTGWMGSAVNSITQGYTLQADPIGNLFHLQPVYLIATNAGNYLVDGITKTVTPV